MNIPAIKLATNGTLEIIVIRPRVVRRLMRLEIPTFIESRFMLKVPEYIRIINTAIIIPIDRAIPAALLNNLPAKYPKTPPTNNINNMGAKISINYLSPLHF